MSRVYRTDIDGLRAVAVVAVILFHLGYIINGYLGVDVFFVISGYLITGIVYSEVMNGKFSILHFYERRIRRIIPLLLFITFTAIVIGVFLMLPDDLENLCQAAFASNLSINNLLMYVTSSDYWAGKNEYKPLMHTWSLGIEEQFYLLYPFLFFLFKGKRKVYIFPILTSLTVVSILAFVLQSSSAAKFYFIQYRFFELSIGGVAAIYFMTKDNNLFKKQSHENIAILLLLFGLCTLLIYPVFPEKNDLKIFITIFFTTAILVLGQRQFQHNKWYKRILCNQLVVKIGKISFSLYLWHQLIFAFARYGFVEEISHLFAIILSSLTVLLSLLTYHYVENPFRNRKKFNTRMVLLITGIAMLTITSGSFYIYIHGGILKDYPSLGLYRDQLPNQRNFFSSQENIHIQYNEEVRKLDKVFSSQEKTKVLVIGNSYGRDFVNTLNFSKYSKDSEVKYFDINRAKSDSLIVQRSNKADLIFIVAKRYIGKSFIQNLESKHNFNFPMEKLWMIGTKDFGYSSGIHYNKLRRSVIPCDSIVTQMSKGVNDTNLQLKDEWGDRYIDLISLIQKADGRVAIFTNECKFISQDTEHLTKFGARYFAQLLEPQLNDIFSSEPTILK